MAIRIYNNNGGLFVVNTYFSWQEDNSKVDALNWLIKQIKSNHIKSSVVITGDFNTDSDQV